MNQTFNIKRFGQCLKLRFLDPMTLRYTLVAAAMLAPMIAVSVSVRTMTMAGIMGCGIPMFFGIAIVTNKITDTLMPATAAEKFLSWLVAITSLIGLFLGLILLAGLLFVGGNGQNFMPEITVWRLWLSGYAGCAALVMIGNLQWMTQNLALIAMIPGFALVGVNFVPYALSGGVVWTLTLTALTIALWIGAYLTYRHRIVRNN